MRVTDILSLHGSFVKEQAERQEVFAKRYADSGQEKRAKASSSRAAQFTLLLQQLKDAAAAEQAAAAPSAFEAGLRLTPEEIRDLPEELIEQLSISESDRRDFLIVDIIERLGGIASIDKILVAIYRETGEIEKRSRLNARLYRMDKKGLVYAHPARKGIYSLAPVPEGQQLRGLNDTDDGDADTAPEGMGSLI